MSAKKILILGLFIIFSLPALPQTSKPKNMVMADFQKFHFGYSVGLNAVGFTLIPKPGYRLDLVRNPGININLITDYRLGKFLNIRFLPGIQFGERDLTVQDSLTMVTKSWRIESVFVDLPFLLKYRAERINNYAPYLIAGVNTRFDLVRSATDNPFKPAISMLKSFDLYPELGAGVDFYVAMVKVALELKFAVGTRDIFYGPADPDYAMYVSAVDKIYSKMVIISFHVEQSR